MSFILCQLFCNLSSFIIFSTSSINASMKASSISFGIFVISNSPCTITLNSCCCFFILSSRPYYSGRFFFLRGNKSVQKRDKTNTQSRISVRYCIKKSSTRGYLCPLSEIRQGLCKNITTVSTWRLLCNFFAFPLTAFLFLMFFVCLSVSGRKLRCSVSFVVRLISPAFFLKI